MRSHSDDSHTHTHLFDLIPRPSNLKVCTDMLQDMKGYTYKENDARDLKYSVRSFFGGLFVVWTATITPPNIHCGCQAPCTRPPNESRTVSRPGSCASWQVALGPA